MRVEEFFHRGVEVKPVLLVVKAVTIALITTFTFYILHFTFCGLYRRETG
jgi:hypothetical protein